MRARSIVGRACFLPAIKRAALRRSAAVADDRGMAVEDVFKVVSVVLIPSIGAVVWLLREVYGLRGDLRELQVTIRKEREAEAARLAQLERSVERLATSVSELTILIARAGLEEGASRRQTHG
jgi:hypothetical protein